MSVTYPGLSKPDSLFHPARKKDGEAREGAMARVTATTITTPACKVGAAGERGVRAALDVAGAEEGGGVCFGLRGAR